MVCEAALKKKGWEVLSMDLSGLSPVTDYFVITNASTDVHARAIANYIVETLRVKGVRPLHMEGNSLGRWILIDYFDVVIHIFLEETRMYYGLERLWGDAPTIHFDENVSLSLTKEVK